MDKRKVVQFKLDGTKIGEYESIAEASYSIGCDESTIRKVLNSHRTAMGYKWSTGSPMPTSGRILILDIETAPLQAYVWRLWKQNIYADQLISDWFMITWAAKYLGEDKIYSAKLTSEEALEQDDKRIVEEIWKLLDDADIVIAHHGNMFDMPKIRSRFLVHNIIPPSSYKQIDTKAIASKEFGFSSNKLEALAQLLGFQGKNKTEFDLWARCMKGDQDAIDEMEVYNVQDIYVLENVYTALRPYIKGHPNMDLYVDDEKPHCPSCGKDALVAIPNKFFFTQAVKYQLYRCQSCNSLSRAKKGEKYENKKQISAIPR
jgi:rRNA maturation protein Nop10